MAKRTPRSQGNETTSTPPAPPPTKRRPSSSAAGVDKTVRHAAAEPTDEDVRRRAYHLYLERGGAPGDDFSDWLRAEQELKHKTGR